MILTDEDPAPMNIAALEHEYAVSRELDVEGIVKAIALERHGGGFSLILEDPGGPTVHELMHGQRLDLMAALRIAACIADGLSSIHERHVIHGDLRPENVLVDHEQKRVFLTGFGAAVRESDTHRRASSRGLSQGALSYVSPEQTGRTNQGIDSRADLYSLGVMLYEMVTGALPFQSTDPIELIHSHVARRPAAPREVSAEIPLVVSDIVMMLMAKSADDRYQRASGLSADLWECLTQWKATGRIAPFPLGRRDATGTLRIPQRLYGRETELMTLSEVWGRVSRGAAELLLVTGYSGVGKSTLVSTIKAAVEERGYFVTGKFDQVGQSGPYASVTQALRELVQHLVGREGAAALALWKDQLVEALGPNGKVLTDLVPELSRIIGPQPEVAALAPAEAAHRFALVFQRFVRVFATAAHPLSIFLDDLQWADLASLRLLELLVTAPESGHLLVIGAYRDNEIDAAHPLLSAVRAIRAVTKVSEIKLGPLDRASVSRIVADALGCEQPSAEPLGALVFDKTQGNPFFVLQFLRAIHKDGLLTFDAQAGAFRFSLGEIRQRMVTDNVITFMVERIRRLAPGTQQVLELAACIGHRFDLETLSLVAGAVSRAPAAEITAALGEALREGIVLPVDTEPSPNASYRFLHDHISLRYGSAEASPYAYMLYAFMLATEYGRHAEAHQFAKLSLALCDKLGTSGMNCKLNFLFALFGHLVMPLRDVIGYFQRARHAGLSSGDLVYLSYACSHELIERLATGEDLGAVREEVERCIALMERTKVASSKAAQTVVKQVIANLTGRTDGPSTLSDGDFIEADFVASMEKARLSFPTALYYKAKLELAVLYGDHEALLSLLARAGEKVTGSVGFYFATELSFYASLAILAQPSASAAGPLAAALASNADKLAMLAKSCPENYRQKHLLVQAELARITCEESKAMRLYDEAIAEAEEQGCTRDVALSSELAAKFYLACGRSKIARAYMTDAHKAYAKWGATAKVLHLEATYPELVRKIAQERTDAGAVTAGIGTIVADGVDIAVIVQMLQAFASELLLDNMLDRFMRIVARYAGAQRGFLILERDGELRIEAELMSDPDEVVVRLSTPVEARDDLAISIVRSVDRLREPVVVGNAPKDSRFGGDPYIASRRPRSIACLPLVSQSRFSGLLYLEHVTAKDVFTKARVELLGLLSGQAATAVDNALLYGRVQEVSADLARANAGLESEVARRTEELLAAKDRVERELVERERAERERAALQEKILEAHAERLAELSTPLIPITDRVVVLPLIGTMDADRARQVLEVAVAGVHARRAQVLIVDITGVKSADGGAESTLMATARAVRLLGAEMVITGISAQVAQTLVERDVRFGSIVTKATLQDGIAFALARAGGGQPKEASGSRSGHPALRMSGAP
jgi:GAF domain-containing protein